MSLNWEKAHLNTWRFPKVSCSTNLSAPKASSTNSGDIAFDRTILNLLSPGQRIEACRKFKAHKITKCMVWHVRANECQPLFVTRVQHHKVRDKSVVSFWIYKRDTLQSPTCILSSTSPRTLATAYQIARVSHQVL